MTQSLLYLLAGLGLVLVAMRGLFAAPHLLRKILALNLLGSGVCLVLVALASRAPAPTVDPVPHALVLTGIVVAVSATAFGIALARRWFRDTGRCALPGE